MYFVEFLSLKSAWKCVGVESGTPFPEVDLSDDYWSDYDEKVSNIVTIKKDDTITWLGTGFSSC